MPFVKMLSNGYLMVFKNSGTLLANREDTGVLRLEMLGGRALAKATYCLKNFWGVLFMVG